MLWKLPLLCRLYAAHDTWPPPLLPNQHTLVPACIAELVASIAHKTPPRPNVALQRAMLVNLFHHVQGYGFTPIPHITNIG